MLVFIPKRRRKVLYSDLRPRLGEVFRRTGVAGEQGIEEGDLMPDHVHMMISISENLARPHRDDKNLDELNAWLLEKWFAYATSPSGTARLDDLNGRFSIASVARILERHRPSQRPVGDGIFHNSIFMDVDGIPLGANFVERPRDEVQSCDVLLAVIGPNWLDARDEEGIAGSTIRMTLSASKLVRRYSATFQ